MEGGAAFSVAMEVQKESSVRRRPCEDSSDCRNVFKSGTEVC